MKWILFLVIAGVSVISCLAGLTAGINLNPISTVRFVPNWGSVGDWVSGLGALSAVLVTLWLADKQRREDVADLLVVPKLSMISGEETWLVTVNVVSRGKRPSLATSTSISSKHSKSVLWLQNLHQYSGSLPINLSYGEKVDLIYTAKNIEQIAKFVMKHCAGRTDGLTVNILTTLDTYSAQLDGLIKNLLDETVDRLRSLSPGA